MVINNLSFMSIETYAINVYTVNIVIATDCAVAHGTDEIMRGMQFEKVHDSGLMALIFINLIVIYHCIKTRRKI